MGATVPNYIGFSAAEDGGFFPILPGLSCPTTSDVAVTDIDSTFQILLKKMTKKDSTTRYKVIILLNYRLISLVRFHKMHLYIKCILQALQEFAARCETAELSAVQGMLPFWPRLYCTLSIDTDQKVREAAQTANAAAVMRMGKGIAAYLKQLAGAWFVSQFDTYAPAASIAVNSFNHTFPPWKVVNAIVYCQYDILSYISENITVHTSHTLSSQRYLTREEMENRYHTILITNLHGYSTYFKKVPSHEIDKTVEIHNKILSSARFWKLAKHDAWSIKVAFLNALTSIMQYAEKLLDNEKERTMKAIINNLDEAEPGILLAAWESMLVAVTKINDWNLVVNINELVLPKLWCILRTGGQCCASVIYPNLLPFISQFSKLNMNINNLYMNFFGNMRKGFSIKDVQISRSNTKAIIKSFVECLRYVILVNIENVDLCIRLFQQQFMPVIETSLTSDISMRQCCFSEVAHLIRYWSKNRFRKEFKTYIQVMKQFWTDLQILFTQAINISQDVKETCVVNVKDSQIEFLLILKDPSSHNEKLKVVFSDSNDAVVTKPEIQFSEMDDIIFNTELNNFVNILCTAYFHKINDKYLECMYINTLIKHFESKGLYTMLSKSFQFEKSFMDFYEKNLLPLLLNVSKTADLLDLIFYFITYISDEDKDKVLESLIDRNDVALARQVIHRMLCKRYRDNAIIKRWLSEPSVSKILIDSAKEIILPEHDALETNKKMILLAFDISNTGDLPIEEEIANDIVTIFCESLKNTDNCSIQIIQFLSELLNSMWERNDILSNAIQIVGTLFQLCIRAHNDVIPVARNYWQEGFTKSSGKLLESEFDDLVKEHAFVIWNKVCNADVPHNKSVLLDTGIDIIEIIVINSSDITIDQRVEESIWQFLMACDIKLWVEEVTSAVIYGEIITGNLCISNLKNKIRIFHHCPRFDIIDGINLDNMLNCLSWASFTVELLNNTYDRLSVFNISDDPDSPINSVPYNLNFLGITDVLISIIYITSLAEIFDKHYKSTKHYNNVTKLFDSLKSGFSTLKKYYMRDIHNDILRHIHKNRINYGCMLPYIIRTYYAEFQPDESPVEYYLSYMNNKEEYNEEDDYDEDEEDSDQEEERKEENDDKQEANEKTEEYDEGESDEEYDEDHIQAIQILNEYWKAENIPLSNSNDIYTFIIARIKIALKDDTAVSSQDDPSAVILEKIMSYGDENFILLCRNQDISNISWTRLLLSVEVIRSLTMLVQKVPSKLHKHWDFLMESLTMWQQSIMKSQHNCNDIKVITLITAVSQLCYAIQILINKHERGSIVDLPPTLLDEWKNVFARDIYKNIVEIWKFCTDLGNEVYSIAAVRFTIVLENLGKTISMLDSNILFDQTDESTETINSTFNMSLDLLQSPIPSIQLSAFHTLRCLISEFVRRDKILIDSKDFERNDLNITEFQEILIEIQNVVNTMLMEFK